MNFLGSFAEKAPNKVFISIILGALAGISYALIIPLMMSVLDPNRPDFATSESQTRMFMSWQVSNYRHAAVFAFVCAFILVARTISQVILARVSMDVTTELRTKMYRRIANAPIGALEQVGMPRLVASITSDVPVMIAGARLLPDLLTNFVTLVGMLGFLLYLNASMFWFVMGCIFFGVLTYQIPMMLGRRYLTRARSHLDDLHESIRGLVHGSKELKLNYDKREDYFRQALAENERQVSEAGKTGQTIIRAAINYGDLISFFVIGAVSFVFVNYNSISRQELAGAIMALLYITGPVAALLNFVPQMAMAKVATHKVEDLFGQIPQEEIAPTSAARRDWKIVRFDDVIYQYPARNGDAGFSVGPLNLEIRKGEITFIVGGNGSGKSTLSKMITLHYHPTGGSIHFDGERVDENNMCSFRRGVAAIYSDYYLFDRALGMEGRDVQVDVDRYLKFLALDNKVTFADGRFSTLKLSDGQKRRLALVAAFLEDAELYLFDEWAADQDPTFKSVFYSKILPDLKAKRKAVVVISHDDRYFHLADQLIVMNEGTIVAGGNGSLDDAVVTASAISQLGDMPAIGAERFSGSSDDISSAFERMEPGR